MATCSSGMISTALAASAARGILTVILLVGVLCLAGCASIFSGNNKIQVNSTPSGAVITFPDGSQATTPFSGRPRNVTGMVTISKDGYEPHTFYVDSEMSAWIWGNILFGGLVGVVIDVVNPGTRVITPEMVHVTLVPRRSDATENQPDDQTSQLSRRQQKIAILDALWEVGALSSGAYDSEIANLCTRELDGQ